MTNLGPFDLEGGLTEKEQDMHVCQDYGKGGGRDAGGSLIPTSPSCPPWMLPYPYRMLRYRVLPSRMLR